MNKKDLMALRNKNAQKLDFKNRIHRNCVRYRISKNQSFGHEKAKADWCLYLTKWGYEFVTEAIFADRRSRADIYVLDLDVAIEIIGTETAESIQKKREKYPCRLVPYYVGTPIREELIT